MGRQAATVSRLEEHPNLAEVLGVLAQLAHINDDHVVALADAWVNSPALSEARDRAEQAASQAQDAYGELLDVVERVASSRPLVIVAAAASVGFVLGLLVARR